LASFNYSARSFSPPLYLSHNDGIACLDVQLTTQMSSALGLQDDFTELCWHAIFKMGFPSHYPLDQQGPPRGLLPCPDLDEKFYGTPPWMDCAYPTPVKQSLGR
jgi:hypothetical protein